MDKLTLIINPTAANGRALKLLPTVERELSRAVPNVEVVQTRSLAHAESVAASAVRDSEVVAAMGGDGLVAIVANAVRQSDAKLAVIPVGRGNDFARKLGISSDPAQAGGVVSTGVERLVDVAEANGRCFLGICSAGLDSNVQVIANSTRLPLGGFVYTYAALRALARWRSAKWHVIVDGTEHEFVGYSVAVSNSGVFGAGMYLVPDASIDDGQIELVVIKDISKLRYLTTMPKVFNGTHIGSAGIEIIQAHEVTFEADRPFTAYADGDPIADLPVTVRVLPKALKVLVPSVADSGLVQ